MKVLVCGCRDWVGCPVIGPRLLLLKRQNPHLEPSQFTIITGGASGVDREADASAKCLGFGRKVFPADWKTHGRAAGPIRNRQMLDEQPDLVLAFWDGKSRGTKDTIEEARRRGIPVEITYPRPF